MKNYVESHKQFFRLRGQFKWVEIYFLQCKWAKRQRAMEAV